MVSTDVVFWELMMLDFLKKKSAFLPVIFYKSWNREEQQPIRKKEKAQNRFWLVKEHGKKKLEAGKCQN